MRRFYVVLGKFSIINFENDKLKKKEPAKMLLKYVWVTYNFIINNSEK